MTAESKRIIELVHAASQSARPQRGKGKSDEISRLYPSRFAHLAAAALRAISRRRAGVRLAFRAAPPALPPLEAITCL
jgi:hypothetical protein